MSVEFVLGMFFPCLHGFRLGVLVSHTIKNMYPRSILQSVPLTKVLALELELVPADCIVAAQCS